MFLREWCRDMWWDFEDVGVAGLLFEFDFGSRDVFVEDGVVE